MSLYQDAAPHTTDSNDTTDRVQAVYGYDGDGRLTNLAYTLPSRFQRHGARPTSGRTTGRTASPSNTRWPTRVRHVQPRPITGPGPPRRTTTTPTGNSPRTAQRLPYSTPIGTARPQVGSIANQENYGFDANGNENANGSVVSASGSTTGDNQISTDGNYNYSYDNNGNLVSQVQCSGNTNTAEPYEVDYRYDFRNRLTLVTDKNSSGQTTQVVTYVYDAFNNLVSRTLTTYTGGVAGTPVTGHFLYDGQNMVLALDGAGNVTDRVLYGPAVDQVLADEQVQAGQTAGTVVWTLGDNQNTVRDLAIYSVASQSTTMVTHLAYSAFGQLTSQTDLSGSYSTPFGYTGCYTDPATHLQWNLNRWYNPQLHAG